MDAARDASQKSCRPTNAARSASGPSLRFPSPGSSSTAFALTRSPASPDATASVLTALPVLIRDAAPGPPHMACGGPGVAQNLSGNSDGVVAAFPGAHPDHTLDGGHPDLAIPDLAGAGRLDQRVHHLVGEGVVGDDLHAHLRHEVDG